jgi:hypothetical protein
MAQLHRKSPAQDGSTGRFISENGGSGDPFFGKESSAKDRGGRRTSVAQPVGGFSLVGIDPGKTTGLAIWDAWDGKWYIDQLDAGRGRKVRLKVHGGFIESRAIIDGANDLGLRLASGIQVVRGGGKRTKIAIDTYVERVVVQTLLDVLLAVGPRTIVVVEDFILGEAGGAGLSAAEIGRDGLSPVRLNSRLQAMMEHLGYFNGDAWRVWQGGWWTGGDGRGVQVMNTDPVTGKGLRGVPDFRRRLTRVEQHRVGDVTVMRGHGAVWGGVGNQLVMRYPHQRLWMGNAKEQEAQMREDGWWLGGAPHAMVAMQHAHAVGRGMGIDIQALPERIWRSGTKMTGKGVTAK